MLKVQRPRGFQTAMYATRNFIFSPHIITYIFPQIAELEASAHGNGHEITIAQ